MNQIRLSEHFSANVSDDGKSVEIISELSRVGIVRQSQNSDFVKATARARIGARISGPVVSYGSGLASYVALRVVRD